MYISATNMVGISLYLSADPPSAVTVLPADPMVMFNRSVDLVCTATGDPPINFTWVRMGEKNTHLNPDPTSGSFTLTITNPNQYGVYVCIATNDLGTDMTSVEIVQPGKPKFDLKKRQAVESPAVQDTLGRPSVEVILTGNMHDFTIM